MLVLESGDKLQGDASAATIVDYTVHGLVGTTITQLADGQLPIAINDLYTSTAIVTISGITVVNTDTVSRMINLYLKPSAGTARRLIPKDMTLAAGFALLFDGTKFSVMDTTGQILYTLANSLTVEGAASSTDNAIARWNGTTGKVIQNSGVTIDDSNVVTMAGALAMGANAITTSSTVDGVDVSGIPLPTSTSYNSQSFQNLLQNGNFEFWYAGTSVAPTGWIKGGTGSVARSATTKISTYSVELTGGAGGDSNLNINVFNNYHLGRTFTLGVWVKTSIANKIRIRLFDGVGTTYSSYHTGGNTWEFLTVTRTLDASAIVTQAAIFNENASGVAYIDGAILVEGSVVPAFMEHPFDKVLNETRFKVGSFTRDVSIASGTQAVTGVGFKPAAIVFFAVIGNAQVASWGIDDGTAHDGVRTVGGLTTYYFGSGKSIVLEISAGVIYTGLVLSFDSDGFTMNWTKEGSPTGTATIIYMTFR